MLDGLKNLTAMAGLMKDLPRLKARMARMKSELAEARVEAEAGGGAVRIEADGLLRILAIRIDPSIVRGIGDHARDDDRAMAEDLIVRAVNTALERSRQLAERELAEAAGEMGLSLPPGALDHLLR
jgi:hypothetical protein